MSKPSQNHTTDELWTLVSKLRNEVVLLQEENIALKKENIALKKENAFLRKEVEDLRSKLNINSKNSSLPPSQDPFRAKNKRKPSGKKQGAQPGCCKSCGKHQKAEVPKEAERGYEPRLMDFLTLLSGDSRLGKRKIPSLLGYLGIKISVGTVCNIHKLACELLATPFEEIKAKVLPQSCVNADETSWLLRSKKCWTWIGATPEATFIEIDPSRSQATFDRIFNGFQNTLTTDRYAAYNSHPGNKQVCLAHIDRDFTKVCERSGADGAIGRILKEQLGEVFGMWKQFKYGECSRETLQELAQPHIDSIKSVLKIGASAAGLTTKTEALCYNLLDRFSSLWTFLYEEGVEPTNNLAERGLRPAVIVKKILGGSQSVWGLRFTERIMSVVFTLKQRVQNVFEYLVKCFEAHARANPTPSPI